MTSCRRYEGFCKDLAEKITERTGLQFEIKPVKDGKFGGPDSESRGGFDGNCE